MEEMNNCKKPCKHDTGHEGMMAFVVYGYPLQTPMNCMNPYGMGMNLGMGMMMDERCKGYGCMSQCFPQMNIQNPIFTTPYTRPNCAASDLED